MTTIAFSAPDNISNTVVYEGDLVGSTITWTQRMNYASANTGAVTPIRVVKPTTSTILHLNTASASNTYSIFRYSGSYSEVALGQSVYVPGWENHDLHESGLSVIIKPYDAITATPTKVLVSTDFGATYTAYNIDYMVSIYGANYNSFRLAYEYDYSVQVDETTGVFYALMFYSTPVTYIDTLVLVKSTNGINWTKVKDWLISPNYSYGYCSLAASNGNLYVSMMSADLSAYYVECSADDGATWTERTVSMAPGSVYTMCSLVANAGTVVMYIPVSQTQVRVLQSTDGGAAWNQTLQVDIPDQSTYPGYQSVRMSGSTIVITFCKIYAPFNGASWTDSIGVHDMSGAGTAHLVFWLSIDSGATWTIQDGPLETPTSWQQAMDVFVGPPPVYPENTLVYSTGLMEGRSGWFLDKYFQRALTHYGEEGSGIHDILVGCYDGGVYQLIGSNDAGTAIPCQIRTESRDQGDLRYNKLYGDIMLDCDTVGTAVTATPGFNDHSLTTAAITVNTASRTQVPVTIGTEWQTARNISLDLTWDHNGASPELFYMWEPRFTEEGAKLAAYSWDTSYLTHDIDGYFYHGYLYLVHISTANLTFTVFNEAGTAVASITVTSSGDDHHKDLLRLPVLKGKTFRYRLSSATEFRVEGQESELLIKQWGAGGPWQRRRIFQDVPHGSAA
jgi:hypothetical protein